MLNKPICLSPNINGEVPVVDANKGSIWKKSFIVDGNEPITIATLELYDFNTGDRLLRKSCSANDNYAETDNLFDKDGYWYPINKDNKNNIFTVSYSGWNSAGEQFVKNRLEPYYWTVKVAGVSGTEVTSCESVFYANSTPDITIKFSKDQNIYDDLEQDTILDSKSCTFKATYVQAEGVPLKRYGWRITDFNTKQILVDTITQNQIYGTSGNILCTYDGFINEGKYSVELFVETQNGFCITTEPINFSVEYETIFLTTDFKASTLKNEPFIMLDWENVVAVGGIANGEYSISNNYPIQGASSAKIEDSSSISYTTDANTYLDIDENCYVVLSTQLPSSRNGIVFEMTGVDESGNDISRTLVYDSGKFTYTVSTSGSSLTDEHSVLNIPNEYTWYIIQMSPCLTQETGEQYVSLFVTESITENRPYPQAENSENVFYPQAEDSEGAFYPSIGTWNNLKS